MEYFAYLTYRSERQLLRSSADLGTIPLSPDVAQLDEVEVIAERTTVELRLDKKIYNLGKDLTVRGGTVTPFFESDSEFQRRVRSFNLAFTYRFNQKKKRRGQRQRDYGGEEEFEGSPGR